MPKVIPITLLLSFNLLANVHNGKELFNEKNCLDCHATAKFKVREHKISNFMKLHNQVDVCSYTTETGWFDDEVMDVSRYLNQNFYHFSEKK